MNKKVKSSMFNISSELKEIGKEDFCFEERLVLLCLEKASNRFTSIDFNNEYHRESFKKDFSNMLSLCREAISEANID